MNHLRVVALSGKPISVSQGEESRDFYDMSITVQRSLGAPKEELLLRFDKAQIALLRIGLGKLELPEPTTSTQVPKPSKRH